MQYLNILLRLRICTICTNFRSEILVLITHLPVQRNHADQRRGKADAMRTFARALQRRDGRQADRGDRQPGPKLGKAKGSRLGWRAAGQRAIRHQLQVCPLGPHKGHRCLSVPSGQGAGTEEDPWGGDGTQLSWFMLLPARTSRPASRSGDVARRGISGGG